MIKFIIWIFFVNEVKMYVKLKKMIDIYLLGYLEFDYGVYMRMNE